MTTITATHLDPTVRHDMVLYFDVTDGNPNGDPDNGNQPRIDIESGHGLVTDVAVKRKIRDTIRLAAPDNPRYGVFVEAGHALNTRLNESYTANGLQLKAKKLTEAEAATARSWLCDRYFDIRLFGAVLSTGNTKALGQIRGPLQVGMGRSVDPINPIDHTITRVTQTTEEDIDKGETTEMGGKWTVPYGLYRMELNYSAVRGVQTGVTAEDLEKLYRAIDMMFDHDRSATRGVMATRALHVFSHSDAFGAAPAHRLVGRVTTVLTSPNPEIGPRGFGEYTISVDKDNLPDGVTHTAVIS